MKGKLRIPNIYHNSYDVADKGDDMRHDDFLKEFGAAADELHGLLFNGKTVLVHCFVGGSRSATAIVCMLMKYHKMKKGEAINTIRRARPFVNPEFEWDS